MTAAEPLADLLRRADEAHEREENAAALHLAREAVARADADGEPDDLVEALNLEGVVLLDLERADEAAERFERAVAAHGEAGADDDPSTAAALQQNLGLAHYEAERYEPARTALERAIALEDAAPEPELEALADHLDLLARVLVMLDRMDEARPVVARALAIQTVVLGPDDPETDESRSWLEELDLLIAMRALPLREDVEG